MHSSYRIVLLFILALCLNFVGGCSSSSRQLHYYALQASNDASSGWRSAVDGPIGVGPIRLPEAHVGDGVLTLGEGQQVFVSAQHLWAGDLKLGISRRVADTLSELLNKDDVLSYPWDLRMQPVRQIFLNFERLSGDLNGELKLKVKWNQYDNETKVVLSTARLVFTSPPRQRSYREYVDEINALVGKLAVALAKELKSDMPR